MCVSVCLLACLLGQTSSIHARRTSTVSTKHWFIIVCVIIIFLRSWLGSLWGDLVEAFSDSSSQSPSFTTTSTDPRKLSTMLETIETNLSDMFKVKMVRKVWEHVWVGGGSKTIWREKMVMAWSFCGVQCLASFSSLPSSSRCTPPPTAWREGSPVLGKAVALQDTLTVFPDHTHPNTPISNIIPEYVEGTCHLLPRGKMQVVRICLILLGTLSGKHFISEFFQRACDSW